MAFNGGHLAGPDLLHRRGAGADRNPVNVDGAGAAGANAAAELRTQNSKAVPQGPEQGRARLDIGLLGLAVHIQTVGHDAFSSPVQQG